MGMTPAERAKAYRDRKRAEAAQSGDAVTQPKPGPVPTTQRDAVTTSLAAMKWIVASDAASVAQAHALAKIIDEADHAGDVAKMLSAHRALSRVLHDLGGTPAVRMQHELRSRKLAVPGSDDGQEGEGASGGAQAAGNISSFQRPAKRARG